MATFLVAVALMFALACGSEAPDSPEPDRPDPSLLPLIEQKGTRIQDGIECAAARCGAAEFCCEEAGGTWCCPSGWVCGKPHLCRTR